MSKFRDIERSIHAGVRHLCQPRYWPGGIGNMEELRKESALAEKEKRDIRLWPICQRPDQARRIMRVEIDPDVERALMCDPNGPWIHEAINKPGPRGIHGVDVYVVRSLPGPGWRVINPMAAE